MMHSTIQRQGRVSYQASCFPPRERSSIGGKIDDDKCGRQKIRCGNPAGEVKGESDPYEDPEGQRLHCRTIRAFSKHQRMPCRKARIAAKQPLLVHVRGSSKEPTRSQV